MPKIADHVVTFVPERWGQLDRFIEYYEHSYSFAPFAKRAVSGARGHYRKAVVLMRLADKMKANLQIDRDELEENGFTPALNAEELATIIEAAVLELYSVLDCTIKVLHAVYGRTSMKFKSSTSDTFASPHAITGSFPEHLKQAIAEATWYEPLRELRTELTHLSTGLVQLDPKTGLVEYLHFGIRKDEAPLIIPDIYAWLGQVAADVNKFIGVVFHTLNQSLSNGEVHQVCGFMGGKVLMRFVRPSELLTQHSGRCAARVWFDQPGARRCPLADSCGAYAASADTPQAPATA